jgi:hypothetical protein
LQSSQLREACRTRGGRLLLFRGGSLRATCN